MFLSLEDYERLGEHLFAIDPELADFGAKAGYKVLPALHDGRYPNRRLTQEGEVHRTIHIAMANQPNGERFGSFFPEIPYTIFGGAGIDHPEQHLRWHSPFLHTRNIPFSHLVGILPTYLHQFHAYLSRITAAEIYQLKCTTPLGIKGNW